MSAQREPINADAAPSAVGPYSHAVRHGELLFCSGQIPLDPDSNAIEATTIGAETRQCLENLQAVCEAAGTDLSRTLRATIYTTELDEFAQINDAYAEFFAQTVPARAAVGVVALPKGARVEIDAIVAVD